LNATESAVTRNGVVAATAIGALAPAHGRATGGVAAAAIGTVTAIVAIGGAQKSARLLHRTIVTDQMISVPQTVRHRRNGHADSSVQPASPIASRQSVCRLSERTVSKRSFWFVKMIYCRRNHPDVIKTR
jgi:hypothetical protein